MKHTILALALALGLAACSGGESTPAANTAAEQATLSTGNATDIKNDLNVLNELMNTFNTASMNDREEVQTLTDEAAIQAKMTDVKKRSEQFKDELFNLGMKSKEVNEVRVLVMDGMMRSTEALTIMLNPNKTDADLKDMQRLQKQSMALQQSVGQKLDDLNTQYQ